MKKGLQLVLSYVPRRLPVGMTEFETWSDRIIDATGPLAERDSMKFALATQIMHLAPQRSSVPDRYFIRSLRKAAANQVASQVFQDIKVRQAELQKAAEEKAKQEAAQAQQSAEVTASTQESVTPDEKAEETK